MSKKKKIRSQMNIARKKGYNELDLLQVREIARKQAEKMTEEAEKIAREQSFLLMLGIPLNILMHDYWKKSAKKRMPQFIRECISLYEAVEMGVVEFKEISDLLYDLSGVDYKAEWMKVRAND